MKEVAFGNRPVAITLLATGLNRHGKVSGSTDLQLQKDGPIRAGGFIFLDLLN